MAIFYKAYNKDEDHSLLFCVFWPYFWNVRWEFNGYSHQWINYPLSLTLPLTFSSLMFSFPPFHLATASSSVTSWPKSPQAESGFASWGSNLRKSLRKPSWIMRSAKLPMQKWALTRPTYTGVALLSIHVTGQEDREPQTTQRAP